MTADSRSLLEHFAAHPAFVVRHALRLAVDAHEGQVRKYTGEAFVTHPATVARTVSEFNTDPLVLAAALLHDVVEDTAVTPDDLRARFPATVVRLVLSLTNPSRPEDGDRTARKAIDHAHVARAEPRAQTIKYADVLHNVQSIARHDPAFAPTYLRQKASLIARLDHGHPVLRRRVQDCIRSLQHLHAG